MTALPLPVRPAYDGAWIGAVLPALLDDEHPAWMPDVVAGADSVVVLVIDGFGWRDVTRLAGAAELASMEGGPITTCAPSTTAAALTSISTGVPPSQHGIVGYRLRTASRTLQVLAWTVGDGDPPAPEALQPVAPFGGRMVPVVTRTEFRHSGFTAAFLRGARFVGWSTPAVLVEHCRRIVAQGERLVVGYYDGVDRVAHAYGLRDGFHAAELAATDRLVGDLRDVLPDTCALVVTADHGQVHLTPDAWRDLNGVAGLCAAYTGDGRCRYLHAVDGAAGELASAAFELYGDEAWVMTRDEFVDDGWLGPAVSPQVAARVGDVVVAAHAPVGFVAPDLMTESQLRAQHGSFTEAEMLVPLLAGRGRA